ncbi:hypothetical protein PIROE2DRAFT_1402 [Piromyces sp. E2]|nr:hypothetical protein PIROE2DRAFT_1402 [Piromyces sp. E2]|eukprot:OUM70523.1 hypothetical protein PIROE2DRAFT_1402 [Piromyces sp. E2]
MNYSGLSKCTTDSDSNLCSFATQYCYEKGTFNQTLINETCKSKRCTNGFIKLIDGLSSF